MSIQSLPDELLLKIAETLRWDCEQPQLCITRLALVSRKMRAVAEAVLYRSPCLPRIYHFSRFYVGSFLRTLIERPELMGVIRELDIVAMSRKVTLSSTADNALVRNYCLKVIENLPLEGDQKVWRKSIDDMNECSLAGVILAAVRPLEKLSFRVLHHDRYNDWSQFEPDGDATKRLFRYAYVDPAEVRGLSQLRCLEFHGGNVPTEWLNFPQLHTIRIRDECDFSNRPKKIARLNRLRLDRDGVRIAPKHFQPIVNTSVLHMDFRCNTAILAKSTIISWKYNHLTAFLKQFPALKNICFRMHNMGFSYIGYLPPLRSPFLPTEAWYPGCIDFQKFLERLNPCLNTLEQLNIELDEDVVTAAPELYRKCFLSPARNMAQFTEMKRLTLDEVCMTFTDQPEDAVSPRISPTLSVLPPNLEYLGIRNPTTTLFPQYMATILQDSNCFPRQLRTIELIFSLDALGRQAKDHFVDDEHEVWDSVEEWNVVVWLLCGSHRIRKHGKERKMR